MFDRIIYMNDYEAIVKLKDSENITINLINLHLVFDDGDRKILGEVKDVNNGTITVVFLGEFIGNRFVGGVIKKPKFDTKIRGINAEEFAIVIGKEKLGYLSLGLTPFYEGLSVYMNANKFLGNHFALLGNDGTGKSYAISSMIQNLFADSKLNLSNANFVIFDSTSEYKGVFSEINSINENYNYRFMEFNDSDDFSKLIIPIYLLDEYELGSLLDVNDYSQISIIEQTRKLAIAFSKTDEGSNNYKNYLIANAIKNILMGNDSCSHKKTEVFSILSNFATPKFNVAVTIKGDNYSKQFRECFAIENGEFVHIDLVNDYLSSFLDSKFASYEIDGDVFYTLNAFKKAFEFLLISDGLLKKESTYCDVILLKRNLDKLLKSDYIKYFDVKERMNCLDFVKSLIYTEETKYQILNISFSGINDRLVELCIGVITRIICEYCKSSENSGSLFHLIVDDAHKYIRDNENSIFEEVVDNGSKFGVMLGIIAQCSGEISKYVVSRCSNILLFGVNDIEDIRFIKKHMPSICDYSLERVKSLQVGSCICFGNAVKIPVLVKTKLPNPMPSIDNVNIISRWSDGKEVSDDNLNDALLPTNDFSVLQPIQNNLVTDSVDSNIGLNLALSDSLDIINDSVDTSINDVIGDVSSSVEHDVVLGDDGTNVSIADDKVDEQVVSNNDSAEIVEDNIEEKEDLQEDKDSISSDVQEENKSDAAILETVEVGENSNNVNSEENNENKDELSVSEEINQESADSKEEEAVLVIPNGDDEETNKANDNNTLVMPFGDNLVSNDNKNKSKDSDGENNNLNILNIPTGENSNSSNNDKDVMQPSVPLINFGTQDNTSANLNNNAISNDGSNSSGSVSSLITFNNGSDALPMNNSSSNNNSDSNSVGNLINFSSTNNDSPTMNNFNISDKQDDFNKNPSLSVVSNDNNSNSISGESSKKKNKFSDTFSIDNLPDVNLGSGVSENSGFLDLNGANVVNADSPGNNSAVLNVPQIPSNLTLAGGMSDSSTEALSFDNNSSLVSFLDKM